MPIVPLPQFEADLAEFQREQRIDTLVEKGFARTELEGLTDDDLERFERKRAPRRLVVRFGDMKMVGEFPYNGDITPGCGSKMVVTTHRGTELGEMLTSTCPNSGCSKSVSRKEMLEYIKNSGGRDYPFFDRGRVLRVATTEDMDAQAKADQSRHELRRQAKDAILSLGVPVELVDAEPILGGERTTFYVTGDESGNDRGGHNDTFNHDRLDLRALTDALGTIAGTRVDIRQVGARDEARLVADYEKCGQYCCCKNFLKVLKPVSMRSAKTQRGTLDPLKISGRCGRLMCCLRYEDETYEDLRRRLPNRGTRVGTPDGDGEVIDSQILTQLAMVRLDSGRKVAVPIEELAKPGAATAPPPPHRGGRGPGRDRGGRDGRDGRPARDGPRDRSSDRAAEATEDSPRRQRRRSKSDAVGRPDDGSTRESPNASTAPSDTASNETGAGAGAAGATVAGPSEGGTAGLRKKRRRRRNKPDAKPDAKPEAKPEAKHDGGAAGEITPAGDGKRDAGADTGSKPPAAPRSSPPASRDSDAGDGQPPRKKRRRRRRRPGSEGGSGTNGTDGGGGAGSSGNGSTGTSGGDA